MVDADAVEHTAGKPPQHEQVCVGEDLLPLHVEPDEGVDVEEAPVRKIPPCGAPEGEAVVLPLEEAVEGVGVGIDQGHGLVDRRGDGRSLVQQARQRAQEDAGVTLALADGLGVGDGPGRQTAQSGTDALQLVGATSSRRHLEQAVEGVRRHREDLVHPVHLEHGVEADEADLTGLQHPPVVVAEHRQQHLVAEARLGAVPVDVEVSGVAAGGPVLQHVPPPCVLRTGRHVVRHDVENLAETVVLQGGIEPGVGGGTSELLVDPPVVDDVVGRAVEVGDAQRRQIAGQRPCLVETEAGPELHPVRAHKAGNTQDLVDPVDPAGERGVRHAAGAPGSGASPSGPRQPRK